MTTNTPNGSQFIKNEDFATALKLRIGIGIPSVELLNCGSCHASVNDDELHYLSCNHEKSGTILDRHNLVAGVIIKWVRQLGGSAISLDQSPNVMANDTRKRPDIKVVLGLSSFLIDVVVKNPAALSNIQLSQSPASLCAVAEKSKRNMYELDAKEAGSTFIPFALEVFGACGKSAAGFISRLATFGHDETGSGWSAPDIYNNLTYDIAAAVQTGNSRIIHKGYYNSVNGLNL
jgi:hypothetical protein